MSTKIKKILIVNRAEIAVRIIRTCQEMEIETVALYSEDDADLLHVKMATESYSLGAGTVLETYLNQSKILEIAKKAKVDAIHPGYGFLSENPSFCLAVEKAGIIFIGPSADVMQLMGSKKESKQKVEQLGVPLVPGYHGNEQSLNRLQEEAKKIGTPLLIKASAGGGGKGMRIVHDLKDFVPSLEMAKSEAMKAFGDDNVLLEKYIVNPRHIEVQVMADKHGHNFHFFERECSVQRRYQKVIEESPAPRLNKDLRDKICKASVDLIAGIKYVGAGTVEYILDESGEFYFLEMNTRLQVEHPITEMVTGCDLVKLQIQVAQGDVLSFSQTDIKQQGHSIECRIYSEDPDEGFLPTLGTVQALADLSELDFRFECGYLKGSEVGPNYDPMLAKVIVHGESRDESLVKMNDALEKVYFAGIKTNRSFLMRALHHPLFVEGKIHTHFIADHMQELARPKLTSVQKAILIAAEYFQTNHALVSGVWGQLTGFRSNPLSSQRVKSKVKLAGEVQEYLIVNKGDHWVEIQIKDESFKIENIGMSANQVLLHVAGEDYLAIVVQLKNSFKHIIFPGVDEQVKFEGKARGASAGSMSVGSLQSPMPGKVFKLLKSAGDHVKKNEAILILEAMKMEHTICAHKDGILSKINYALGDQVQGGVELAEIE